METQSTVEETLTMTINNQSCDHVEFSFIYMIGDRITAEFRNHFCHETDDDNSDDDGDSEAQTKLRMFQRIVQTIETILPTESENVERRVTFDMNEEDPEGDYYEASGEYHIIVTNNNQNKVLVTLKTMFIDLILPASICIEAFRDADNYLVDFFDLKK